MRRSAQHVPEAGQAAVESAIILPAMIFLTLGILQLTMMQQASLMTEYAAYQACRAGIVWNGNNGKMVDAARVALAPTLGPVAPPARSLYVGATGIGEGTGGMVDLARNIASFTAADAVLGSVGAMTTIRVDVVNPTRAQFQSVANYGPVANPSELFFDDVGDPAGGDGFNAHENYRKALQLTIRLRYLYELRIPFADWVIQTCFLAANAPNIVLSGALGEESGGILSRKTAVESGSESGAAAMAAADARPLNNTRGKATFTRGEFMQLLALRQLRIYVVPLTASYTLRMQSNLYVQNLTN